MFYKKQGLPESGEIVICTVKRVLPDSVFVDLDEYNKEAMIHISEVSPGRIRNIRDFVKEGKKIVCKVININKEKGYVDLSLRRVNQAQKINKNNSYKQEQKAEKVLQDLAKKVDTDLKTVYEKIGNKIIEKYETLTLCFNEIVNDKTDLKDLKIDNEIGKNLIKLVKEKIKPSSVDIVAKLSLESDSGNGIELIKKALNFGKDNIEISYISAPFYRLKITARDYKTAESSLKNFQEQVIDFSKKNKLRFELRRWNHKFYYAKTVIFIL